MVALVAGTAPPARAAECTVNPHAAWQVAQQRGWRFLCAMNRHTLADVSDPPGAVVQASFQPDPPHALRCTWRTGPASGAPPTVKAYFFVGKAQLGGGWHFSGYTLAGGPHEALQAPGTSVHLSPRGAPVPTMVLPQPQRVYSYRLTQLRLSKPGGNCARAIDEAF